MRESVEARGATGLDPVVRAIRAAGVPARAVASLGLHQRAAPCPPPSSRRNLGRAMQTPGAPDGSDPDDPVADVRSAIDLGSTRTADREMQDADPATAAVQHHLSVAIEETMH